MKRTKTFKLPKLRYHRASKQSVVELAGKQHYLGPHSSPECEASYNRLIAEWVIWSCQWVCGGDRNEHGLPSICPISNLFDIFAQMNAAMPGTSARAGAQFIRLRLPIGLREIELGISAVWA